MRERITLDGHCAFLCKRFGKGSSSSTRSRSWQNKQIYITGHFNGTATFGSFTLTSYGGDDAFIAKYITGTFAGHAIFGTTTFTNTGKQAIFIAQYNSSGKPLWALNPRGHGAGQDIKVDDQGHIYITGE